MISDCARHVKSQDQKSQTRAICKCKNQTFEIFESNSSKLEPLRRSLSIFLAAHFIWWDSFWKILHHWTTKMSELFEEAGTSGRAVAFALRIALYLARSWRGSWSKQCVRCGRNLDFRRLRSSEPCYNIGVFNTSVMNACDILVWIICECCAVFGDDTCSSWRNWPGMIWILNPS